MHYLKTILLITFLFLSSILAPSKSFANSGNSSEVVISPVVLYSNSTVYRGALIWPAGRIIGGAGLTLFNSVSLGGNGLSAFIKPTESVRFSVGITYFDDNGPSDYSLPLEKRSKDFRNQRRSSMETLIHFEFRERGLFNFNLTYYKEIKTHYGYYFEMKGGVSLIPLTNFGMEIGYGSKTHNEYVFGERSRSGWTHYTPSIGLMLPFLPGGGIFRASYSKSYVIHKENKNSSYVMPNDNLEKVSLMMMWNVGL